MTFCVLVTSADSRKDIYDICFANSEHIWKDCPWPRFAKFGSFENWCQQVTAHVNSLPLEIEYILLMVEDVLFMQPVNAARLQYFADTMHEAGWAYLRLVPLRRPWLSRRRTNPWGVEQIPRNHPYYSSTEMALWHRDYLLTQLRRATDAWAFEHLPGAEHWAVEMPIFDQHQIVQKGCWNWDAPRLLRRARLSMPPTKRPYQSLRARWRGHRENLSFALFGFTSFRIKRWLRNLSRA